MKAPTHGCTKKGVLAERLLLALSKTLRFALVLVVTACTSNTNQSGQLDIKFSPASGLAVVGDTVTATYVGSTVPVAGAQWKVMDPTGGAITCNAAQGNSVSCNMQVAGQFTFTYASGAKSASASLDVIQPPGANPEFGFVMKVKDSTGAVIATVSTDPTRASGDSILRVDDAYTLEFTAVPENPDLTYAVTGGGLAMSGNSIARTCAAVGALSLIATATDANGNVVRAPYTEFCQCKATADTMVLDPTKIVVTQSGAMPNMYSFQGSPAISGGTPPYRYNWAPESTKVFTGWTLNDPAIYYRAYADSATSAVKVLDACNFLHQASFTKAFNIPLADGAWGTPQGPQESNNQFLQGFLTALNPSAALNPYVNNRKFIAIQTASADPTLPVYTRYHYAHDASGNGTLTIASGNLYNYNGTPVDVTHGFAVNISGIKEPPGNQGTGDTSAAFISSIVYSTDASGDGLAQQVYTKVVACPLSITMKENTAVAPCAVGPSTFAHTWTFDLTFNCPEMQSTDGSQLSVTTGAGYGEVAALDACVGGGGGGGGGEPPPAL